ncbi:IclR family transcriptional regulator [Bosea thiooxidans]|nr:IclR family transcriptional regulator [Bosea sp. (in: a-proteobacteria)]
MTGHENIPHMDPGSEPADGAAVKSAVRVLDLLEFLGRWDGVKTHTEIVDELGIPKSSLTQLLKTLVNRGYLKYKATSKGYSLGPAIARLARRVTEGYDLVSIAQPILEWIVERTGESCALNFLKGDRSEVVAAEMSRRRLLYHMAVGDTAPLYATSGGKALLAFLPEEMREEYLDRVRFEKFTNNTINATDHLRDELDLTRAKGVAYVHEEYTPGIVGISKPILSKSGFPLGSINIAIPAPRYNPDLEQKCLRSLSKAVEMIYEQSGAQARG